MKCVDAAEISRLVLGELEGERAAELERHLARCEACAAERDELRRLLGDLAPDRGEFDDPAFAGDVMTLIRLGRASPRAPRTSWWAAARRGWQRWAVVPLVAAATAGLVLAIWPHSDQIEPPFQARSGAPNPDSWVSIQAFRAAGEVYQPVSGGLAPGDALAFSYANRSRERYGFLMIFGVDSAGRVFWYYPAYTDPATDPPSVRVEVSEAPQTLPHQVRHDLRPGPLRLFGVFSRRALRVRQVEAAASRDLAAAGSLGALRRLGIEDTGQHSFLVVVRPPAEQRGPAADAGRSGRVNGEGSGPGEKGDQHGRKGREP